MIHRHRWEVIEQIGRVTTQQCQVCWRTRIRILPATRPDRGRPNP